MLYLSISNDIVNIQKEEIDNDILSTRLPVVIDYYSRIFSYKLKLYSQLICSSYCPYKPTKINYYVHLIKTNLVYADTKEINFIELIKLNKNQIPKNTTHILFLDLFGMCIKIISKGSNPHSLTTEIFGDEIPNIIYIGDKIISRSINPLGRFKVARNFFNLDQMGFRYSLDNSNIFKQRKDDDIINIAILGGSFAISQYSLPGESFAERLETLLNSENRFCKRVKVWNLSQGGAIQSNYFSFLINSAICKKINYVIWIDGLNDMLNSNSLDNIGFKKIFTPIHTNDFSGFGMINIKKMSIQKKIEDFISYRNLAVELLNGIDVKSINILQPVINLSEKDMSLQSKSLLPFYSKGSYQSIKLYNDSLPYIKSLALSKYNLDFLISSKEELSLEFWDFAHLSPLGENQYSRFLYNILTSRIKR